MAYTSAQTGGQNYDFLYGDSNGAWRRKTIVEAVRPSAGDYYEPLTQVLPARSRILAVGLYNVTALSYTGTDATNTANSYALVASTASSPATGSSASTSAWQAIIASASTVTSAYTSGVWRAVPSMVAGTNQNVPAGFLTASSFLFIQPVNIATSTQYGLYVSTGTAGYKFVSTDTSTVTYQVNIVVEYETYAEVGVG